VKGKYDEDGSCWQSTKEKMRACDDECEQAMEELIEAEGPNTCDGVSDTGTDTGGGGGACPLQAGNYGSEWSIDEDSCGLDNYLPTGIEVSCSGSRMSVLVDLIGIPVECSTSGRNFDCVEENGSFYIALTGTASGDGTTANAAFALQVECSSFADVYLYLD
jgi:hypothetical protein